MEKNTYIFIGIIALLAASSYFVSEAFVDASGATGVKDSSGGYVTVSISDLFALLTSKQAAPVTQTQQTQPTQSLLYPTDEPTFTQQFSSLRNSVVNDVRQSLRNELQTKTEGSVLSDSCIDSVVNQQGNEWMRYIPGKNPADYIRKDSIPCYACNLN